MKIALLCSAVAIMIGLALIYGESHVPMGYALLFFGTLCLSLVPGVVAHELGHALMTLAVGMRLFTVTIGALGGVLFVRQVFGYDVAFRTVPLGGSIVCTPKHLCFARLRYFLVVLGGPLANLVLIVVAQWIAVRFSGHDVLCWVLSTFGLGNVLLLAISLFPRKVWLDRRRTPNDGLLLLTIPFTPKKSVKGWHSCTFYYEVAEALERGRIQDAERWLMKGTEMYPKEAWIILAQASILGEKREYQEARRLYLEALDHPEVTPEVRAYLWNNIAWFDLMIGDPSLLEEADDYSRQALEELPWIPGIKGTRGAVEIEMGRINEGMLLAEHALRENDRGSDKALNACSLAIALAKQGDGAESLRYIQEAQKYDPKCPLLERAATDLEKVS